MKRYRKRYKRRYKRKYRRIKRTRKGVYLYTKSQRAYPEVKYNDIVAFSKGIAMDLEQSNNMRTGNVVFANMLNTIQEGTAGGQRIGRRIFVKSITINASIWTCGFVFNIGAAVQNGDVNSALLRMMVFDSRDTGPIPNLYSAAANTRDRLTDLLARRNYKIHYDKVYKFSSGVQNSLSTATSFLTTGDIRSIKVNIPVNRNVEYTSTGTVRDDRDVYTLGCTAMTPGWDIINAPNYALDGKVCLCGNFRVRIYFTDC